MIMLGIGVDIETIEKIFNVLPEPTFVVLQSNELYSLMKKKIKETIKEVGIKYFEGVDNIYPEIDLKMTAELTKTQILDYYKRFNEDEKKSSGMLDELYKIVVNRKENQEEKIQNNETPKNNIMCYIKQIVWKMAGHDKEQNATIKIAPYESIIDISYEGKKLEYINELESVLDSDTRQVKIEIKSKCINDEVHTDILL